MPKGLKLTEKNDVEAMKRFVGQEGGVLVPRAEYAGLIVDDMKLENMEKALRKAREELARVNEELNRATGKIPNSLPACRNWAANATTRLGLESTCLRETLEHERTVNAMLTCKWTRARERLTSDELAAIEESASRDSSCKDGRVPDKLCRL